MRVARFFDGFLVVVSALSVIGTLSTVGCAPKPVPPPVVVAPPPAPPPPAAAAPTLSKGGAPLATRTAVKDAYHGVEVGEDYRWLENTESPETKAFVDAQNALTRKYLDGLVGRDAVRARLKEILGAKLVNYNAPEFAAGTLFALRFQPPRQQPVLVAMAGPDGVDKERVLLDPVTLDASGHTSMDWFHPSPDGKYVAVSLSAGGSEAGDAHVFEVASGKQVFEVVPRVNGGTAGGDLEWSADSKGFYYSRYPRGEERPAEDRMFFTQIYYHALGTPTEKDRYELGKDFPRIAEIQLAGNPKGELLATIQKGDGGEFMLFLRDKGGAWTQLTKYEDRVVQAVFGEKGDLYLLSRKDAPRGKLLRASLPATAKAAAFDLSKAKVVVPEDKDTLVSDFSGSPPLLVHGGRVYATYQMGGPSEIRVFDLDGKKRPAPKQAPVSTSFDPIGLDKGDVLFGSTSFVEPKSWFRFGAAKGDTRKTAISTKTPLDLSGVKVLREMATSKDGTKVPVNIVLPKGAAAGTPIPFDVTGYGGYGISVGPSFQSLTAVLLEHGVGLAIVNLRGGGEYGEDWHTAGNLTRKQNVFDDFTAAVQHLVTQKYAAADRVAMHGGSNGGLLMGAVLTQHPELVRVVLSFVGIYDMLRVETSPNGAFNVTEFGTVKDEAQFKALHAYSPYHHVSDGTNYPAVMLLTGANDVRVAPWHSHKMAARLQAATGSDAPILERVEASAGHGMGSALDVVVDQFTDAFTFELHHLGVLASTKESATR